MKAKLSIKYEGTQAIIVAEGPQVTKNEMPVTIVRDENLKLDLAVGTHGNTAIGFNYDQLVWIAPMAHEAQLREVVAAGYFRKNSAGEWVKVESK